MRPLLLPTLLLCLTISLLSPRGTRAEGALAEDHPAIALAIGYVQDVSKKNWTEAAQKLKGSHLERQRDNYVRAARNTPSVDAEVRMLSRLKVERVRDIESMSGQQFYVAHQLAIDNERRLTPTTHARMQETFKLHHLGGVQESDRLVHVLIRTGHETLNAVVSELLIVSMEKVGEGWLVAPEHQELSVSPLITGEIPEGMKRTPEKAEGKAE